MGLVRNRKAVTSEMTLVMANFFAAARAWTRAPKTAVRSAAANAASPGCVTANNARERAKGRSARFVHGEQRDANRERQRGNCFRASIAAGKLQASTTPKNQRAGEAAISRL